MDFVPRLLSIVGATLLVGGCHTVPDSGSDPLGACLARAKNSGAVCQLGAISDRGNKYQQCEDRQLAQEDRCRRTYGR